MPERTRDLTAKERARLDAMLPFFSSCSCGHLDHRHAQIDEVLRLVEMRKQDRRMYLDGWTDSDVTFVSRLRWRGRPPRWRMVVR